MSIKLALLKSGETVISDIKEAISEDKLCGYILNKPHKILTERSFLLTEEKENDSAVQVSLAPWILLTEEENILVAIDSIITIVEPITSVKNLYEDKVNENN